MHNAKHDETSYFCMRLSDFGTCGVCFMERQLLTYNSTRQFSSLVLDYLDKSDSLSSFYSRPAALDQVPEQLREKSANFSAESRSRLVNALKGQYSKVSLSSSVSGRIGAQIDALSSAKTFTVTTGHQLNLFSGPLYFLYKIFGAINLAEQYTKKNPNYNFVPVFWMASEDHDFEEISHFRTANEKINWDKSAKGPVGRLHCTEMHSIIDRLKTLWGSTAFGRIMLDLFISVYTPDVTLAAATRKLVHEIFKDYDLLVIDGDDPTLKLGFTTIMRSELEEGKCSKAIENTSQSLITAGYHKQVHPREINLFYCQDGQRERIIATKSGFIVDQTDLVFTKDALLSLLEQRPELFSPNALLRPLYQESVLPNLAYIGGGAEVAYWLQLKNCFDRCDLTYPMVYLRNSVSLVPAKIEKKLKTLNFELGDLFLPIDELSRLYINRNSSLKIDFTQQKDHLKKQFAYLYDLAKQTDASFLGAVGAQEKKQLKGLERLEQRLLRAEKRKHSADIQRLTELREWIFPGGVLQERTENMSWGFEYLGSDFLSHLKTHIDPSDHRFTLLIFNS